MYWSRSFSTCSSQGQPTAFLPSQVETIEAVGRMALLYIASVCILDLIGRVPEGSTLADRFSEVLDTTDHASGSNPYYQAGKS